MPDLDPSRVRAFLSAAEHGNFTQAAAELFITQQALSKRISALESSAGPLFIRHSGGVTLTERGRSFLPLATRLMSAHDDALMVLHETPAPTLRVDVWNTIQTPALMLGRFADAHPQVQLELSYRKSLPAAIIALQRNEIDVAFGNVPHLGRTLPSDIEAEPCLEEEIAGLVRRDDPLREVTLEAARDRGLWFPGRDASPELANYMRWVGDLLGVRVDTTGSNASLALIYDRLINSRSPAIGMTGRDWPMPSPEHFRVVQAPVIPKYQWWLVRRRGWTHPTLDLWRKVTPAVSSASAGW